MLTIIKHTPRWLIFLIDILIVLGSLLLAYLVRFNFNIPANELGSLPSVLLFVLLIRGLSFVLARTYAGIIRYTSTEDAVRIFLVILGGSLFFVLTNIFTYYFINQTYFIPFSIIIIEFITSIFIMTTFRLLVKITYLEIINPSKEKSKVIIFGAGEAGVITKRALDRDAGSKLKVIGFIDDDKKKAGKKLEGVDIFGPEKMKEVLRAHQIDHLILSVQNLSPDRKKEIIETCLEYETRVLNVPPVVKWINGELSFSQIREINIDDLLGREVIKLDDKAISEELSGKNILVTGASGSIGSEIARQVAKYKPNKLMLLDQAESPLHQLELECADIFRSKNCEIIIADICNEVRMEKIFHDFMPTIIYHAAAYKHVPMMENNPVEALQTNVIGTKILADLAVKYNVGKFIMISTDKAVNPANVMGASKRIAEMYTQSQNQQDTTRFITTRFGNVLGSNGSVIPLFKKQIAEGGPITITHPEVTRYFMTIPEASQLVLDAGAMGKGGEIFIFDMGKSVKIADLAKKMIKLSGLTLGKDIQIVYAGLRPGEKLYEELLNDQENTVPTHHPLIMIAKEREYDKGANNEKISELIALFEEQNDKKIVSKMKQIVPEFKSANSVYEELDSVF